MDRKRYFHPHAETNKMISEEKSDSIQNSIPSSSVPNFHSEFFHSIFIHG
jgi:hypothetical protein